MELGVGCINLSKIIPGKTNSSKVLVNQREYDYNLRLLGFQLQVEMILWLPMLCMVQSERVVRSTNYHLMPGEVIPTEIKRKL